MKWRQLIGIYVEFVIMAKQQSQTWVRVETYRSQNVIFIGRFFFNGWIPSAGDRFDGHLNKSFKNKNKKIVNRFNYIKFITHTHTHEHTYIQNMTLTGVKDNVGILRRILANVPSTDLELARQNPSEKKICTNINDHETKTGASYRHTHTHL